MAALTFTLDITTAVAPEWCGIMVDDGAGLAPATSAFGYQNAAGQARYLRGRIGATGPNVTQLSGSGINITSSPLKGTGNTPTTAGDYFRSLNRYTGVFAAGTWAFTYVFRATTAGMNGSLTGKLWVGSNSDGSGARAISTSFGMAYFTITPANTDFPVTTSANVNSAVTLNDEYIFLCQEWAQNTTTSGQNCFYRRPGSSFVTTEFTPTPPVSQTNVIVIGV